MWEALSRRICGSGQLRKKKKTLPEKITKTKKDWGHGSSDRVPA
jgi:hypothetical protein